MMTLENFLPLQQASKLVGYSAKHFSFNIDGGR